MESCRSILPGRSLLALAGLVAERARLPDGLRGRGREARLGGAGHGLEAGLRGAHGAQLHDLPQRCQISGQTRAR